MLLALGGKCRQPNSWKSGRGTPEPFPLNASKRSTLGSIRHFFTHLLEGILPRSRLCPWPPGFQPPSAGWEWHGHGDWCSCQTPWSWGSSPVFPWPPAWSGGWVCRSTLFLLLGPSTATFALPAASLGDQTTPRGQRHTSNVELVPPAGLLHHLASLNLSEHCQGQRRMSCRAPVQVWKMCHGNQDVEKWPEHWVIFLAPRRKRLASDQSVLVEHCPAASAHPPPAAHPTMAHMPGNSPGSAPILILIPLGLDSTAWWLRHCPTVVSALCLPKVEWAFAKTPLHTQHPWRSPIHSNWIRPWNGHWNAWQLTPSRVQPLLSADVPSAVAPGPFDPSWTRGSARPGSPALTVQCDACSRCWYHHWRSHWRARTCEWCPGRNHHPSAGHLNVTHEPRMCMSLTNMSQHESNTLKIILSSWDHVRENPYLPQRKLNHLEWARKTRS